MRFDTLKEKKTPIRPKLSQCIHLSLFKVQKSETEQAGWLAFGQPINEKGQLSENFLYYTSISIFDVRERDRKKQKKINIFEVAKIQASGTCTVA